MGNLKYGDIYTKDLDLVIQFEPTYTFPSRDVTTEHIPGRNGDLVIDNKCWSNVERVYSLASAFRPGTNFIENAEKFIKFLTEKQGYQRLEDTYDPKVYRMALFKNNGSLQNYYDKATAISVSFECKPQRYFKIGEDPVDFTGSSARILNPTGYPALPIISISGIEHSENGVLLITIKNEDKVTSTITVSDVPSGDVIIDSELQTVSSIQNGDINKYVGLNDSEFPVLYNGNTDINIKKYIEDTTIVERYELVMTNTKLSCLALYKPYDALVESKQKSFYIKSYSLLKQQVSEVYEATAYSNYCIEKAEEYTFISFNTVLSNKSQSYTFQGDFSSAPEWLHISRSNDEITISVGNLTEFASDGSYSGEYAYFISSNDKIIRKLHEGSLIGTFKASATITITAYPAELNSPNRLAIDYSDYNIPSWLSFEIEYDDSGSPINIIYKSNAAGYYYLPKSGLFGSAGWKYLSVGTVLTSLAWSSYKKAFMPSGISTSTNASFQYYYLEEAPQYEPTYKEVLDENGNVKKDANGNPIKEIDNDVHFNVVNLDGKFTSIKYVAKHDGYYRCNNADQSTAWKKYTAGQDISAACGFENTVKSSNIVYYMSELPTYDKLEGFPDWLDPNPILSGTDVENGNPTFVELKVKISNWYRCTYISNEEEKYTEWLYLEEGASLSIFEHPHLANDSYSAYMIEGPNGDFPIKQYTYTDGDGHTINDIGFFYIDDNGQQQEYANNTPPSWITVDVIPGENEDGSDTTIKFKSGNSGLYNWDANTVWINKNSGSEIVESSNKDDTSIYYLETTPIYPTEYPLFDILVNTNAATGNPESITFIVKEGKAGYFRAKNSSSWKFYNDGDEICNSKITESTTIYNLDEESATIDGISIVVKPRWWSL